MCCNPFLLLARLLRSICGEPQTVEDIDPQAQEQLLGSYPELSAPVVAEQQLREDQQHIGQLTQIAVDESAAAPQECTTTIIVMRHGHRQDEEDPFWHQNASRPWDPPLSVKGRMQATDAAAQLDSHSIDYVITSPFRRCLQTSAGVVKQLQLSQGQWLVDWQLSEICDPRVLFASRHDAKEAAAKNKNMEAWMWGGLTLDAALDKFSNGDCKLSKLTVTALPRTTPQPKYPERLEQGLERYSSALQEIAHSYPGKTVLVVTHGECVRMAVLLAEPNSEVFEVKHTGFVVLQQHYTAAAMSPHGGRSKGAAAAASWKLTSEPGETGVLWLEDE